MWVSGMVHCSCVCVCVCLCVCVYVCAAVSGKTRGDPNKSSCAPAGAREGGCINQWTYVFEHDRVFISGRKVVDRLQQNHSLVFRECANTYTHAHTHTFTCAHARTHTHTHIHTHTRKHAYTHINARTCTHTHMHINTHMTTACGCGGRAG